MIIFLNYKVYKLLKKLKNRQSSEKIKGETFPFQKRALSPVS